MTSFPSPAGSDLSSPPLSPTATVSAPAGFLPAAQAVAQVTAPALLAATSWRELQPAGTQDSPRLDPNAPNDPATWTSATSRAAPALLALLLLPLFAFTSGGCVSTSAQFKVAAPAGVNALVGDMKDYTANADWDTNHNGAIDPNEAAAQAAEGALTATLAASVADQSAVTVEGVEGAWRPVEPLWRKYVVTDPTLDTPEDKKIRNDTGDGLNRLIQVEKDRQAALKSSLGLSALFGSTPAPPTPAK